MSIKYALYYFVKICLGPVIFIVVVLKAFNRWVLLKFVFLLDMLSNIYLYKVLFLIAIAPEFIILG